MMEVLRMADSQGDEFQTLAAELVETLARLLADLQQAPVEDAATGVTRSQLAALRYLAQRGTCSMQDLAAGVGVTAPTMTSTVKLLMKKGLVERRHDEVDWRSVRVTATDRGIAAQAQVVQGRIAALARSIASLTAEQRAMLMLSQPALRALAEKVGSASKPDAP